MKAVSGVALSTCLLVVAACGSLAGPPTDAPSRSSVITATSATASPSGRPAVTATAVVESPSLPPEQTLDMTGVTQILLPALGGNLVVVGDALWAATDVGAVRVEPATGDVSERIRDVTNLAFDGERLWAGGEKLLIELDPQTGRELRRFSPDHNAFYVAATPDAVWATDTFEAVVQRIDPSDGHVVATIEVPARPKGTTLGEGSVWVACDGAATVIRIDTTTNEIVAEIPVGNGPHNIAVGGGSVWVTNRSSTTLSKIDPATNQVAATVAGVGHSPAVGVAVGPRSVYVAYRGGVAVVDAERAEMTARFEIENADFYDLKLVGDTLWASNASGSRLYGIDIDALSND